MTVFFTLCTNYTNYTVHMNSIIEPVNLQTPHLTAHYWALFESVAYFRIEILWHAMQCPAQWTAWPQQILQNVRNHLSNDTLSHPRRLESTATMLQETWIWHSVFYHHIVKGLTVALHCLVKGMYLNYLRWEGFITTSIWLRLCDCFLTPGRGRIFPFCCHVAPAPEDMDLLTSEHQLHDCRQ